jgi:MFS transporter, NNP family, nitrate/nitrite transporter
MKFSDLKHFGHWPTLVSSFLWFDHSFMVWTLLGALANQIVAPESMNLTAQQRSSWCQCPFSSAACSG